MGTCLSFDRKYAYLLKENEYLNTRVLELESRLTQLEESMILPAPTVSLLPTSVKSRSKLRRPWMFWNGFWKDPTSWAWSTSLTR